MPYYSVREKSERGMHAWVPAGLYPSPDSHMKSRERGGRCSLGRSGDPHLSSTTTPPGAPPYVRLNNGPLDQHHLWPYQQINKKSSEVVFYFKYSRIPLYGSGMRVLPVDFEMAHFILSGGNQLHITDASIRVPRVGTFMALLHSKCWTVFIYLIIAREVFIGIFNWEVARFSQRA